MKKNPSWGSKEILGNLYYGRGNKWGRGKHNLLLAFGKIYSLINKSMKTYNLDALIPQLTLL
ncbi:MAG: hypothetical protein AAGA80_26925, partial [Cyanobacteria bacterium P01_F01_bin.143]